MKTKKRIATHLITAIAIATGISFSANAELIDQFPAELAEWANAHTRIYSAPNAGINLYIDGSGVNRVVTLAHQYSDYSQSPSVVTYWRGTIPADAVSNGFGSIDVNVNTCDYTPTRTYGENSCGQVNVSFVKDELLWITNGSVRMSWDPLKITVIGRTKTFRATVSGTIKGVDLSGARFPAMGLSNNVTVLVELPDESN